jgi:hypothetical protein
LPHFHIEGLPPYDGDYEIDLASFTHRELHTIKRVTSKDGSPGVRAGEMEDAFAAGDTDLVVAFCLVALQRANLSVDENRLWDAPVGAISLVADEVTEEKDCPPDSAPSSGNASNGGVDESASANITPSGVSSSLGSA